MRLSALLAIAWFVQTLAIGCIGDTPPGGSGPEDEADSSTIVDAGSDTDEPDAVEPDQGDLVVEDRTDEVIPDAPPETGDPVEDPGSEDMVEDRIPPDMGTMDSDDDTILDQHEGYCWVDTDEDGTPDCYDLDSDDDGIPDAIEAGDDDLLTQPVDTDEDGTPDFQDLDSDGDGIFDEVEGSDDADLDGDGNWIDWDSDGDNLGDSIEGTNDFDEDLIPDYLDTDSDNDWIPDWLEGVDDTDGDEIPDRFDSDSDDDGWSDADEAGDHNLATAPLNSDEDSIPDFRDLDSDGDGLADRNELGCDAASTERLMVDSDGDTYSDMAEVAVGSDPCDSSSDVYDEVEFFFILPPDEEVTSEGDSALEFSTELQQIDVHINMDTTGSMGGEINALKCDLTANTTACSAAGLSPSVPGGIISAIDSTVPNSAFGVSSFRDFPASYYGSSGDWAYLRDQQVTTVASQAQTAVNGLLAGGGADGPESGYESLYQIATGSGLNCQSNGCGQNIPSYPPAVGRFGGAGFRNGSYPFVVHITDAISHRGAYHDEYLETYYPSREDYPESWGTHNPTQTYGAMAAISTRVMGVASLGGMEDTRQELEDIAIATGAVVPVCAFDGSRPTGCNSTSCCTGISGEGVSPVGGECPLVFTIASNGAGLGGTIVDAIEFMAGNITMTVTTELVGNDYHLEDPAEDINSACFITSILPDRYERESTCGPTPRIVGDHFEDVTPGTQVFFEVIAENDGCVEPREDPLLFDATINIWGDGLTLLDDLKVTIIVPPEQPGGPK